MVSPLQNFDKAFENRIRLGIMGILMVNDKVDFGMLKKELELTDGNLASHLKALEKVEYISVKKQFIGRKPNTVYLVTAKGKKAFNAHLDALDAFLKNR